MEEKIKSQQTSDYISNLTYEDKVNERKKFKEKVVERYKSGDIASARIFFLTAISYLENMIINNEAESEGINLYTTTLSNLWYCYNKQKEYDAVVHYATIGIKIKELPKLYYFRAISYANNEEFDLERMI